MKNIALIYTTEKKFREFIMANEIEPDKEYLVRIHTCIHSHHQIMPFVEQIKSYLPNSKIIGSSTSGVIFNGKIMTDCCMICITEFKKGSVNTFIEPLSANDGSDRKVSELYKRTAEIIGNRYSGVAITLFARQYLKVNDYVNGINQKLPNIKMIGGFANNPSSPLLKAGGNTSFVFNENKVSLDAVVCAYVLSDTLYSYSDIIYVIEPVGQVYTITDADGSIIRSVDGKNAVDWYKELLGLDLNEPEEIYKTMISFPLARTNYSNMPWAISYSMLTGNESLFPDEPEPVMYVPSEAKVGDQIRIAYSSVQKTIDVCENVCENIAKRPSEALFGYSCVSRQDMFKNCAEWELLPFEKTNLCGALVAGEIGNIDNANRYCNYSFAIMSVAEENSAIKLNIKALSQNSDRLVEDQNAIVNYLIKITATKCLEKNKQQIDIENTLFIDNNVGFWNITKYMYDSSFGKHDKLCMITIKNENLLKAFLSKSKFNMCFNRYLRAISSFLGKKDYSYYIYKETSLIVTADDSLPDEVFNTQIQKLQTMLNDFKFSTYVPVNEFSVVMHEENMIKKAELTLVRMRNKKDCFLTYTSELGLEQFNAQKMKMIMLLNHAISHDGVVPYYQGIRDNKTGKIQLYESLMRIVDEEGNVYTPYAFMEISKEYGYYSDISQIMIKKVLERFKNRSERVTINMSINDVYNYSIVHMILDFLENAPHPENYIFELIETEDIDDYQIIFEFTEKVHSLGSKIAIDDFGSGFSNIVHVFKIPSDYIKIDGEIIKNICSDIYALEFLEMIADWSLKHEKSVIAEYVENNDIQSIIEKNHIQFSQGYLYSKPSLLPENE